MKLKISLAKVSDVKKFISFTQESVSKVTVQSDQYLVDGKSILGVFSLDLSDPVIVESDDNKLMKKVKEFEVK